MSRRNLELSHLAALGVAVWLAIVVGLILYFRLSS